MDAHTDTLYETKLKKTQLALIKNNMDARILENKEQVAQEIQRLIFAGASVSVGGSQTLFDCDIINLLRTMDIRYDDRYQEGLSKEEMQAVYRRAFMCDFYLASSNA
ncbi:MAG: lactate utilization protein, partial [Erysipelotrichia bacterium]|nr:lactate utilization protein [Erysipelotrichia bacterium]